LDLRRVVGKRASKCRRKLASHRVQVEEEFTECMGHFEIGSSLVPNQSHNYMENHPQGSPGLCHVPVSLVLEAAHVLTFRDCLQPAALLPLSRLTRPPTSRYTIILPCHYSTADPATACFCLPYPSSY
jgi:hypothetical protein